MYASRASCKLMDSSNATTLPSCDFLLTALYIPSIGFGSITGASEPKANLVPAFLNPPIRYNHGWSAAAVSARYRRPLA